ncbi:hypothetical protein [Roseibium sp. SCP14]|uniref:hypothetical protein n=1 Tax=Roseibium sp. SCP14 TaxID=3141375 RepID=UPI003336A5F6
MIRKFFQKKKKKNGADTFLYTVNELNNIKYSSERLASINAKKICKDFLKYKKSNTLFVLGSGPTINDLDKADFELIAKHDSIGFNWWLVHDFVPTMYMFQFPPNRENEITSIFKDRENEYKEVPIIFRGSQLGVNSDEYLPIIESTFGGYDIYFMNEFPVHSKCEIDVDKLIQFVKNLGFFEYSRIPKFFVKWRGTLGLLVSFGYAMGYERIVLCGIDMNDETAGQHFFDATDYNESRSKYSLPASGEHNIHTMMDTQYSKNTVGVYLAALNQHMRTRNESQIYVASSKSALASILPLWPFKQQ